MLHCDIKPQSTTVVGSVLPKEMVRTSLLSCQLEAQRASILAPVPLKGCLACYIELLQPCMTRGVHFNYAFCAFLKLVTFVTAASLLTTSNDNDRHVHGQPTRWLRHAATTRSSCIGHSLQNHVLVLELSSVGCLMYKAHTSERRTRRIMLCLCYDCIFLPLAIRTVPARKPPMMSSGGPVLHCLSRACRSCLFGYSCACK